MRWPESYQETAVGTEIPADYRSNLRTDVLRDIQGIVRNFENSYFKTISKGDYGRKRDSKERKYLRFSG